MPQIQGKVIAITGAGVRETAAGWSPTYGPRQQASCSVPATDCLSDEPPSQNGNRV